MGMEMDIEAICWPDYDRPAMQTISVAGKAEDGRRLCTLDCLRWAEAYFDITRSDNLAGAFDEHSAFAYGLAEDIQTRRRAMMRR